MIQSRFRTSLMEPNKAFQRKKAPPQSVSYRELMCLSCGFIITIKVTDRSYSVESLANCPQCKSPGSWDWGWGR